MPNETDIQPLSISLLERGSQDPPLFPGLPIGRETILEKSDASQSHRIYYINTPVFQSGLSQANQHRLGGHHRAHKRVVHCVQ